MMMNPEISEGVELVKEETKRLVELLNECLSEICDYLSLEDLSFGR